MMSNQNTPIENDLVAHAAAGNLAFLMSVIRCRETLSEAEEANVRSVIDRLEQSETINILLWCPRCGEQHVDEPQPEKQWTNPPHRSHECQFCEHVWRPADCYTNGVATIQTKGQRDGNARPRFFASEADFDAALRAAIYEEGRAEEEGKKRA